MSTYRCYFLNKIGSDSGRATIHCDSDQSARLRVLDLLDDRPRVQTVEVWQEMRRVFRHNREQDIQAHRRSGGDTRNYPH